MSDEDNMSPPAKPEDDLSNAESLLQIHIQTDDSRYAEICRLYWQHNEDLEFSPPVTQIAKQMGTTESHLTKVVKECSYAYSFDDTCSSCEGARIYRTRSEVTRRSPDATWVCEECREKAKKQAEEEKRLKDEERRKVIDEHYAVADYSFDPQKLSLVDCVYLLSVVRAAAPEDLDIFLPLDLHPEPLSPSRDFSLEILTHLYRQRLLCVHPSSPVNAFDFDDSGEPISFYPTRVSWALPTGGDLQKAQERVAQLEAIFRKKQWPDAWYDQTDGLWKRIAYEEVLQYLLYVMREHDLPFTPGSQSGSKTELVISEVLEEWSASQGICLCWAASKEAAAYYMRGKSQGLKKSQAANSVLGRIQRQSEDARVAKRDIKKFGRSWDLPQSAVSRVLFNAALQIGEKGFNERPGLISFHRTDDTSESPDVSSERHEFRFPTEESEAHSQMEP